MKSTTLLMGLALAGLTSTAMAQTTNTKHHSKENKTEVVTPPDSVNTAFQAKFSGDTATWAKTPAGNFCATVTVNGEKEHVEFTSGGQWLSNKTDLTTDQLPDSAKSAIQTQFPGMEIATVQKLEYENVTPFYKVDLKQGDQDKSIMVNEAGFIQQ